MPTYTVLTMVEEWNWSCIHLQKDLIRERKGIFSRIHPKKLSTSISLTLSLPLLSGPKIRLLRVSLFSHLLYQKDSPLLLPAIHFKPLLKVTCHFFKAT